MTFEEWLETSKIQEAARNMLSQYIGLRAYDDDVVNSKNDKELVELLEEAYDAGVAHENEF